MASGTASQQQAEAKALAVQPTTKSLGPIPTFESNKQLLRYLYADLTRISQIASADIILHPADRSVLSPSEPVKGIEAVQAHEERLVAATGGTIQMEVEDITANAHFGTVLGTLHACSTGGHGEDAHHTVREERLAMPFCGLWRFVDGKAVEHWENAADPARLGEWLIRSAGGIKAV